MEYVLITIICLIAIFAWVIRSWYFRDYNTRHAAMKMFLTHTPDGFPVGRVVNGYRVTSLERLVPTELITGGVAPCWQVYGINLQNDESKK